MVTFPIVYPVIEVLQRKPVEVVVHEDEPNVTEPPLALD
jgi:hypothetical protein